MRIMTKHQPASCSLSIGLLAATLPAGPGWAASGPEATPGKAAKAAAAGGSLPPGRFTPTRDSIQTNYRTPAWFRDTKLRIFMHWRLYTVPAHACEWYAKPLNGDAGIWHTGHFDPLKLKVAAYYCNRAAQSLPDR